MLIYTHLPPPPPSLSFVFTVCQDQIKSGNISIHFLLFLQHHFQTKLWSKQGFVVLIWMATSLIIKLVRCSASTSLPPLPPFSPNLPKWSCSCCFWLVIVVNCVCVQSKCSIWLSKLCVLLLSFTWMVFSFSFETFFVVLTFDADDAIEMQDVEMKLFSMTIRKKKKKKANQNYF